MTTTRERVLLALTMALVVSACGGNDDTQSGTSSVLSAIPTQAPIAPTTEVTQPLQASESVVSTTASTARSASTVVSSTTTTTTTTTTVPVPTSTPYAVPVENVSSAGWGRTHSGYPATDIFLACGSRIVSPVNGTVLEVRRENLWKPSPDNPAHRGGLYVSVRGDDGVRYYMAHFESIEAGVEPGVRVGVAQPLGTMGQTGRASACHLHFAVSPPCPEKEWAVRRGVVWPFVYLDDWRSGRQTSPAPEVQNWSLSNPNACVVAAADAYAPYS
jgi:peptidoglycan LD-endopeptidase LytH